MFQVFGNYRGETLDLASDVQSDRNQNHRYTGVKMDHAILEKLETYIASVIIKQPGRAIPAQEALLSSGLIDSFSLIDLALFVEDSFGVRIDDTELNAESFDSLAELAELITNRQA
jgi:acyl carrier protein